MSTHREHDQASPKLANTATLEPQSRVRSSSRMSTTTEYPYQSTPKPNTAQRRTLSTAHTGNESPPNSRPASRASRASSQTSHTRRVTVELGSRAGGRASVASSTRDYLESEDDFGDTKGVDDSEAEGERTLKEANRGSVEIIVPTEASQPRTSTGVGKVFARLGLGHPTTTRSIYPLAPPAEITTKQTTNPVNKQMDKGKNPAEPSPSAEAIRRRRHREKEQPGEVTGLINQIAEEKKLTEDNTLTEYKIRRNERALLDLTMMTEIMNNKERMDALIALKEGQERNGGRDKARNKDSPEQTGKQVEPATPKNKAKPTLGVRINDLGTERRTTHTPAPSTSAKNQGLPAGGYLAKRLATTSTPA
ncbi:hypothetical protein RSOLAG1IB_11805 [Rhizoctonia solani AG-1 IB]|uniref:Uncharacterized protein n=1 Tax=Thanatephorus cucumeris (strain AG1-IB / isolate 7/3/14) TaxID=1108050 RepID=A0A0B7FFL7_THACB|nr:hypothetical protein RSOLAG1IB_11805 [Rhizoctonia solani AG-1 IB]